MVNLKLIVASSIAAVSVAVMWVFEFERERRRALPSTRSRAQEANCYVRGMREREYIRLIPEAELQRVKSLLRQIYKARGWSTDDAAREQAWARVIATAQGPDGGSWQLDFNAANATPQQLQALCATIDTTFLGGLLSAEISRRNRPSLRVVLGLDPHDPHSWLSGLHDNNTIYVNAARWSDPITECNPMNFEGTLCHSKLEALAHTLGHELVHAAVLNFLPDLDASSAAYLPDGKHGPIFMLLNKRLFGHTGHASHRLFSVKS